MKKTELENNIQLLWKELESCACGVTRAIPDCDPVFMLKADNGSISFLLRFSKKKNFRITKKEYVNISIECIHLSEEYDAIDVTLNSHPFRSTFTVIAADVVIKATKANNEDERLKMFLDRLYTWSNVFKRGANTLLSEDEQLGLYGELTFLKDLCESTNLSVDEIVNSWKGAIKEDKDFQLKNRAVEIKSSSKQDKVVEISNIRQLDESGLEALYLHHYEFARTVGGKNTLPDKVNEIREIVKESPAYDVFEDLLISVAYFDKDASEYTKSYTLIEDYTYLVGANFPRIVASMVPGITEVKYKVNLGNCGSFMIKTLDMFEALTR